MEPLPEDPYLALGLAKDFAPANLKANYRKLVLKYHPDKVQDQAKKAEAADLFHKIQLAYEILSDEDKRSRYDAQVRLAELRKESLARRPTQPNASYSSDYLGRSNGLYATTGAASSSPRYEERSTEVHVTGRTYSARRASREHPEAESGRQRHGQATSGRDQEHTKSSRAERRQTSTSSSDSDGRDRRQRGAERPKLGAKQTETRPESWQPPSTGAGSIPTRMPFSTTVFYDLQLDGELNGRTVSTFPDKGAGWNFLSRAYARRDNLQVDASDTVTVYMANGKPVQSLGSIKLPFRFKDNVKDHLLDFHVLPRCISDVILGNTFLRVTSAFTQFAHCVRRTLRQVLPHRVCFLGGRQHRMGGWLDGYFVAALPDTGSDLMLMSRSYAKNRGFVVDDDPEFCVTLQMGDLSTTRTSGYVGDIEWKFGDQDGNEYGRTELCGFWIVDDLACDVIFSDEFLLRTNALDEMAHCEFELETNKLSLSAIKAIRVRAKKTVPPLTALEEWNRQAQKERLHQSEVESDIRRLPVAEQEIAREELERRWKLLEAQRPVSTAPQTRAAQDLPPEQYAAHSEPDDRSRIPTKEGQRPSLSRTTTILPDPPRKPDLDPVRMSRGYQYAENKTAPRRPPTPIPDQDDTWSNYMQRTTRQLTIPSEPPELVQHTTGMSTPSTGSESPQGPSTPRDSCQIPEPGDNPAKQSRVGTLPHSRLRQKLSSLRGSK